MSHCFFCCEWIMTQPQFQKFFENSFPSDVCPPRSSKRMWTTMPQRQRTQTNDCKRWWIVIDAVRTYCGFCRLQPPKTVWIYYCYVAVARIFYGTTSLVLSFASPTARSAVHSCNGSLRVHVIVVFSARARSVPNVESFALAIAGVRGLPLALLEFHMMLWLFNFTSVCQLF